MRILAFAILIGPLASQDLVLAVPGTPQAPSLGIGAFGSAVAALGDLDRDGHADLLVGCPADPGGPRPAVGFAAAISGRTGLDLRRWTAEPAAVGSEFGASVAGVGDVDGDLIPDLLVGEPDWNGGEGQAVLLSGAGPRIRVFRIGVAGARFGTSVAAAGDVDADGRDDLLVTSTSRAHGARRLEWRVYSGADFRQLLGSSALDGWSAAPAGDVDGDGHDDVVIGEPTWDASHPIGTDVGQLRVVSGRTGGRLFELIGTAEHDFCGVAAHGVGDVDGDGYADVATFGWNSLLRVAAGGPSRRIIHTILPDYAPNAIRPATDVDGDGRADFLVAVADGSQTVRLHAGRDGAVIRTWGGSTTVFDGFGWSTAWIGDSDADGSGDVAIGAPWGERFGTTPRVEVRATRDLPLRGDRHRLSILDGGEQLLQLDFGSTEAGLGFCMLGSLHGVLPGVQAWAVQVPLNPDVYMQQILGNAIPPMLTPTVGALDGLGRATVRFDLPAGLPPEFADWTFHHAAVVIDPGGFAKLSSQAVPVSTQR